MTGVNKYISECHDAPVRVAGDSFGEGTNHYVCIECKEPCDFYAEFQKPVPTPPNPNNEIEAELREQITTIKNRLAGRIETHRKVARLSHWSNSELEQVIKEDGWIFEDEMLALMEAHTQEQIRLARLDELLHVYDTDALYFYDDKEDSTTVGRRIKELRDSATEYLDKSVKGDK